MMTFLVIILRTTFTTRTVSSFPGQCQCQGQGRRLSSVLVNSATPSDATAGYCSIQGGQKWHRLCMP